MGMDVYGRKPKTEKGEYFRNNVWYWHPLWDYCEYISPDITKAVNSPHSNDGDGLGAVASRRLGFALKESVTNGTAEAYVKEYYEKMANLPKSPCVCTVVKSTEDSIGTQLSLMLSQMLYDPTGTIPFPKEITRDPIEDCSSCNGTGLVNSFSSHYHINLQNISDFSDFLIDCGGFNIC